MVCGYAGRYGKVIWAQILLAAYDHPEWSSQQIARDAGCTGRTARKWQRRWAKKRSIPFVQLSANYLLRLQVVVPG